MHFSLLQLGGPGAGSGLELTMNWQCCRRLLLSRGIWNCGRLERSGRDSCLFELQAPRSGGGSFGRGWPRTRVLGLLHWWCVRELLDLPELSEGFLRALRLTNRLTRVRMMPNVTTLSGTRR